MLGCEGKIEIPISPKEIFVTFGVFQFLFGVFVITFGDTILTYYIGCQSLVPMALNRVEFVQNEKYSAQSGDFLRFLLYICHVIDDFCLS